MQPITGSLANTKDDDFLGMMRAAILVQIWKKVASAS